VFPGDPESSYEADFAGELANARWDDEMCDSGYQQWVEESARRWRARGVQIAEDLVDEPGSWLDGDWWQSRIPDPDYRRSPTLGKAGWRAGGTRVRSR
jgi:hypothetical protein